MNVLLHNATGNKTAWYADVTDYIYLANLPASLTRIVPFAGTEQFSVWEGPGEDPDESIWGTIQDFGSKIQNAVVDTITSGYEYIASGDFLDDVLYVLSGEWMMGAAEAVGEGLEEIKEAVVESVMCVVNWVIEKFSNLYKSSLNAFQSLVRIPRLVNNDLFFLAVSILSNPEKKIFDTVPKMPTLPYPLEKAMQLVERFSKIHASMEALLVDAVLDVTISLCENIPSADSLGIDKLLSLLSESSTSLSDAFLESFVETLGDTFSLWDESSTEMIVSTLSQLVNFATSDTSSLLSLLSALRFFEQSPNEEQKEGDVILPALGKVCTPFCNLLNPDVDLWGDSATQPSGPIGGLVINLDIPKPVKQESTFSVIENSRLHFYTISPLSFSLVFTTEGIELYWNINIPIPGLFPSEDLFLEACFFAEEIFERLDVGFLLGNQSASSLSLLFFGLASESFSSKTGAGNWVFYPELATVRLTVSGLIFTTSGKSI